MECPNCHTVNSDQKKYCHECGTALPLLCPRCKAEILPAHKFCGDCGFKLLQAKAEPNDPRPGTDGERKHVTVLFSDLSGYTALSDRLDAEEVREISRIIFAEVARIVANYQGFIEKFIGDAVLAIFGLPAVHEDDPVKAVKAATHIHRFVRSLNPELEGRTGQPLSMHSGIHTGLVVTGEMIVDQGIHGIVGDTLNLASRLAGVAEPDEILVSKQTNDLVQPYFETHPRGPMTLKGFSRPVEAHRIGAALEIKTRFEAAKRHGFTRFIGRDREMRILHACLEKVLNGEGQFVTVAGEAGVGKSRLAYEFRHGLEKKKLTVLQGRCQAYGSSIPYLPFLNALKRGLSLKETDNPSQLEEKVIANTLAIDSSLEQYLPLYLHLLSIPSNKFQIPEDLHGQRLKLAISQALAAMILLNARQKPMVLIFEDWHWVDEASDAILKHLASLAEPYPLMMMVLYRPEHSANWPDWPFHTPCVLKAMASGNTAHIIQSIWKVDQLPDGFAALIHDRTGGNPFFVEEVCKALTEDGSVRMEGQQARLLKPIEKLSLPATVQAVIRARLDRLDADVKETLQLAAVIGREFPFSLLEHISNEKSRLPLSLDVLKTQELIQQTRLIPEAEFMFKHVLTQVTAYESLLLKQRREYHASVGQALEHIYVGRLEEQCENLAHHYSNSADSDKALVYLQMAATKATGVHSLSEARKYYARALSLLDSDQLTAAEQKTVINLSLKWAEVSQYAPSNKIKRALMRSLDFAKKLDKRDRIADVFYWVGKFGYMQGDFIETIPQIEQCIQWARELNDHQLLAVSYNLFGRTGLYTGRYAAGITHLNQGLEIARPYKKWDDIAYSTAILGLLLGLTGNYKSSMQTIAKAIKIARRYEIPTFEAMAFGYLGSIHFWYGNWKAAINNCRQCIEKSRKLDNPLPISWGTFFKGAALFHSGEQEEGLSVIRQSIEMRSGVDSVLALRFFYALYAESLAVHGNHREAQSINKRAMALSQSGQQWGEIANYRTMALLAVTGENPDWDAAAKHMRKSIEISKIIGSVTERVVSFYRFADLMHKKGDVDSARKYYGQGKALADKIGCRIQG